MANYTLDFTTNPQADQGTDLTDFESRDITILGKNYFILDFKNTTSTGITLLDSASKQTLAEGETTTLTSEGNSYEVSIDFIGSSTVKLDINGEVTIVPYKPSRAKISDIFDALNQWCPITDDPPIWLDDEEHPDPVNLIPFQNGVLDFTDYMKIIIRKDNWKQVFVTFFKDRGIISAKLKELEPIRNAIAHFRELSKDEQKKLELYCKDILMSLQKSS